MILSAMSRTDLEVVILEEDLLPSDAAGCAAVAAMTDDELRAVIGAWIEAGDECSDC